MANRNPFIDANNSNSAQPPAKLYFYPLQGGFVNWERCLDSLKEKLALKVFEEHFVGLRLVSQDNSRLVLELPAGRDARQFERLYRGLVEQAAHDVLGADLAVEVRTAEHHQPSVLPRPSFSHSAPTVSLQPQYNFETFVVGDRTRFAYSAAIAVAQQPSGNKFNPLLIYGGTGLGKTHLIQAIGNFVLELDSGRKVRYLTADEFYREYVDSIQDGRIDEMARYYRNEVDLLLLDDVQNLSGKGETQREFFHVFNALHQNGRQIVLTSDKPPNEIRDVEERLISRFQSGLCVDVQPPELETREAILRKKASLYNLNIADDIIAFLAASIESNVRQLEGAIRKILHMSALTKQDVSMDMARRVVEEIAPMVRRRVNFESIVNAVAQFFSVEEERLLEEGRGTKEVAQARQVAMYLMRHLNDMSLKSIGQRFGGRDHSTVVHAIKTVEQLMTSDASFSRAVEGIKSQLR